MDRFVAALGGAVYFLGFPGFDVWPLCFVALVPLYALFEARKDSSRKHRFSLALIYGTVQHAGGFYWLVNMLDDFSGFSSVVNTFIASLFWVAHGSQFVLLAWLHERGRSRGWPLWAVALGSFTAVEWLFPSLFPNFLANSLHDVPILMQVADLGGAMLLSGIIVLVNVAVYESLHAWRGKSAQPRVLIGVALGVVAASLVYGGYRIHEVDSRAETAPTLNVGMVQVSMGVHEKRNDPREMHRRHLRQSLELEHRADLDLIVWPESAINRLLPHDATNVSSAVMQMQTPRGMIGPVRTPLLFGGITARARPGGERAQWFNTAFLLDGEGEVLGTYDKTYLLAFGEYLPFGDTFPILYDWSPRSGRFSPGTHVRALPFGEYRLATLVCYEDVLPAFTRRMVVESDPHLLVNVTNDAWFGDTNEPWIHLALAKFRAVEHHRSLVRATNSGVSAIVDPVGRVVTHSGVFTRESLHGEVPMMQGQSVYAMLGDWFAWLATASLLWMLWGRRRYADAS